MPDTAVLSDRVAVGNRRRRAAGQDGHRHGGEDETKETADTGPDDTADTGDTGSEDTVTATGFDQGDPPWTQQRLVPEPNSDQWSLLNLDIHYRFDWARLTSVTSWLDRTIQHEGDGKAVYQSPFITTVTGVYDNEQQDFTQEFRLQSVEEGRLDWLMGLFYQHQDYSLYHEVVVPGFDERTGGFAAMFGTPDRLLVTETDRPTKQTAAFGDVIYRFSERWEGTLGGRWFRFRYSNESSSIGPLTGAGSFYQGHASESGFTPRLGLSYHSSDELMLYGMIAGGYRNLFAVGDDPVRLDVAHRPGRRHPEDILPDSVRQPLVERAAEADPALTRGEIREDEETLVRVQTINTLRDVLATTIAGTAPGWSTSSTGLSLSRCGQS